VSGLNATAAATGALGGGGASYPARGMKRRDMMKLMSLVMLPMTRGLAMASSDGNKAPLRYKVLTATRPGLNRDMPPGKESLAWVANSATLIYGEQDALLVDTFLTVEQSNGLANAIVASGKTLKAIYITHAHGDHFFGVKVLQDRFPSAKALATPAVVARMKLQITPEKLDGRWRKLFPNQIPEVISIADPLQGDEIDWKETSWSLSKSVIRTPMIRRVFTSHPSDWSSPAMPFITAFIHFSMSRTGKLGWNGLPRSTRSTR
jgi:Metallo-beta-lactamase superfamily